MPVCLYICQIPKEEHIHPLNLAAIAPEKWWGRLLREGPPWRPGPRPPPRRRGSHPSTVRPRSTSTITRRPYHKMMICLFAWWCFFLNLDVFYIYMISIWYLLGQWYLSDFYSMCVYENILPTSYWCFWQYVLVNWKSGHWMRVIQTLEFGCRLYYIMRYAYLHLEVPSKWIGPPGGCRDIIFHVNNYPVILDDSGVLNRSSFSRKIHHA